MSASSAGFLLAREGVSGDLFSGGSQAKRIKADATIQQQAGEGWRCTKRLLERQFVVSRRRGERSSSPGVFDDIKVARQKVAKHFRLIFQNLCIEATGHMHIVDTSQIVRIARVEQDEEDGSFELVIGAQQGDEVDGSVDIRPRKQEQRELALGFVGAARAQELQRSSGVCRGDRKREPMIQELALEAI